MRRLWKRRWLLIPVALAIFLSVGAVAWAATGGGSSDDAGPIAAEAGVLVAAASMSDGGPALGAPDGDFREAMKEAAARVREGLKEAGAGLKKAMKAIGEHWRAEGADRKDALRDEMTPQDRARYDDLLKRLDEQRAELREIREEMKETLGELRDLCKKYLPHED